VRGIPACLPVCLVLLVGFSSSARAQDGRADPPAVVEKVGGAVKAPVVLLAPPPEYSEQARKKQVSGSVLVGLIVDTDGNPRNVRVIRGIGNGLDEKAIKAVRAYKFKPAVKNGEPVAVALNIEVNFQIFPRPQ
jgi:protein TonB